MNEDDSLQMANILLQMGYRYASRVEDADLILLNTCSVREKPERKVLSKLGELRELKSRKPHVLIGVCGCMAQRVGVGITKVAPHVDMVVGTDGIPQIPHLIDRVKAGERPVYALELPERNCRPRQVIPKRKIGEVSLKQFVPIMYGCDNFCTYCVVPTVRGPERSRPIENIVAEVEDLVARGCREVTLIGQNVNSYKAWSDGGGAPFSQRLAIGDEANAQCGGEQPKNFAHLLERLNEINDLWRIRFTTSHPKDLTDELIEAMRLPKVCEHLHLPLQSGDNDILRAMNRHYTVEHYISLVEKVRQAVPGIAITTDVMVGFPGETEDCFRNTLRAIQEVRFDAAFMFAFNPRPGTKAAEMPGQVDYKTKTRRLVELIELQNKITLERNEEQVGTVFEVLVEGVSEKDTSKLTGHTRTNKTVVFPGGTDLIGRLVMVRSVKAHPWGFTAEPTN